MKYILKGYEAIPASLMEWADWFENADRTINRTNVGDVSISTVFIGMEDQLFETMIFGGEHDEYQTRCSTYIEAEKMHKKAVKLVKKSAQSHQKED